MKKTLLQKSCSAQLGRVHPPRLILLSLLVLAAFAGYSYFSQLGVNGLEPLQPIHIIDNEDKTDTIRGVDADHNGIRDDIDRLIAEKYADTPQLKKAMEQSARVEQLILEVNSKEDAEKIAAKSMNSLTCIDIALEQLPPPQPFILERRTKWLRELQALLVNTKQRFAGFRRSEELLVGSSFHGIRDEDAVCDK